MPRNCPFGVEVEVEDVKYSVAGRIYSGSPGTRLDPPEGPELDVQHIRRWDEGSKTWVEVELESLDEDAFEEIYDAALLSPELGEY